ncbi:MAG: NAD-dependent succinate-semialdehyde dehydrogenase [Alphaproteobacteria bacterium]|jgi:succinate-semialdehyde dehydrogenase/glutarate-semialdehyde dehydrogenase|nr:NAD-dependent succinate-semialdehyde dehydrogenase [Alphaproteobacteria bacterium]
MTYPFPTSAFIGGAWFESARTFPVVNPASGVLIAEVSDLGGDETEAAIRAAEAAFPAWSGHLAKERAAIVRRWGDLLIKHAEDLAQLITAEGGKPLAEARGEVAYAASFCEWFSEEAKRAYGRTIPTTVAHRRYVTIKQPIGVAAAITPWNFPLGMVTRKAAPALAAGCTLVLKPAEATPLTALFAAKLAAEAGLPPGVLNVVTSNNAAVVGKVLCESTIVRKLSFTGSTRVGKILAAQCAGTVKRLSLELGGNAPFIVFEDADLDKAAAAIVSGKFRNAGQVCVATNRVLVHAKAHDALAQKLAIGVSALKVGDGAEEGVQVGPLIQKAAVERVDRLVKAALASGAKALTGAAPSPVGEQFYAPTVLSGVTPEMDIAQQEIFGPVATLIPFGSDDEAVRIANATPYGLAAYFFTNDISRAWRVAEKLDYGMVSVNEGVMSNEVTPFGGMKESGVGREGGAEGLDEFLEVKFINFGGIG